MGKNPEHSSSGQTHHQAFWLAVMCLTGVDYFSTLGYQPSIAFEACGRLAPIATFVIVLMTLFGALPIYSKVASLSSDGSGSIGMVERMQAGGWIGKILVITLLGFVATDFIITITLSGADAAAHLVENPLWSKALLASNDLQLFSLAPVVAVGLASLLLLCGKKATINVAAVLGCLGVMVFICAKLPPSGQQMTITISLVVALGVVFWIGFREAIMIAVGLVALYMILNTIIIVSGYIYIAQHPEVTQDWWHAVLTGEWHMNVEHSPFGKKTGIFFVILTALFMFPRLALGLSGFETGVAVMPLVKGQPDDSPEHPKGRIKATRWLLLTAALIMSFMLIGSNVVVTMLVPPEAFEVHDGMPTAKDRALAYVAHGQTGLELDPAFGPVSLPVFGEVFGTIYDASTIAILWFAGASAMAGLLILVAKYLPRYGMAPEWVKYNRPQVVAFTLMAILVTIIFKASVSAQGDAYATGVLALMTSACVAVTVDQWHHRPAGESHWSTKTRWRLAYLLLQCITIVFVYTLVTVVHEKPAGIIIAGCFIVATFTLAIISRIWRARELRNGGFRFVDAASKMLWTTLTSEPLESVLIPHRPGRRCLSGKLQEIEMRLCLSGTTEKIVVEAERGDASEFSNVPELEVMQQEGHILIRAYKCASIAHTITAIAIALGRPKIIFGWSEGCFLPQLIDFLLFGEGNVPQRVYELLLQVEPDETKRPQVIVG